MSRLLHLCLPLLVLSAFAAPPAPDEPKPAAPPARRHAVLVGVNQPLRRELPACKYAAGDVRALAKVLRRAGFHRVLVLADDDPDAWPTAKNLRTRLADFFGGVAADDTLLVAFCGRCVPFKGERDCHFCPLDAALAKRENLLPLSDFYTLVDGCRAKHRFVVLDVCRPGEPVEKALRDRLEARPAPQKVAPPANTAVLFSCAAGQAAEEQDDLKQSVFLHYLLEGLRGAAAEKGVVTPASLHRHAGRQLKRYADDLLLFERAWQPYLVGTATDTALAAPAAGTPVEVVNSVGMSFRYVAPGRFLLGSPRGEEGRWSRERQREVEFKRGFYLGTCEVTQAQYARVTGKNPAHFGGRNRADRPVESVTWHEAVAFCEQLAALPEESLGGRVYHLPSEAEWEYACRGGPAAHDAPFHFERPTFALESTQANFDGAYPYGGGRQGACEKKTLPVGCFKPNALGLFDMHGNVAEWCADELPTDRGWLRAIRGGSWDDGAYRCRAAMRDGFPPHKSSPEIGFRVLLHPPSDD